MLLKTNYKVSTDLIQEAVNHIHLDKFRVTINQPTGSFFYDPWILKTEYHNTPLEELYNSLPVKDKGEARLICLHSGVCYASHSDIDDRYHLNLLGDKSFLIDLDNCVMHLLKRDGIWYHMDAGVIHSAANFSSRPRVQLVVRKLLINGNLKDPKNFKIAVANGVSLDDGRFIFDDVLSKWLNRANKNGKLRNFIFKDRVVEFTLENSLTEELMNIIPKELILI